MTTYKVSDMAGALLDAAVAKAEGFATFWIASADDDREEACVLGPYRAGDSRFDWSPSTVWSQGGPIIERERIGLWAGEEPYHGKPAPKGWFAEALDVKTGWQIKGYGDTPLIAAMRAYVTSKFGETVEL